VAGEMCDFVPDNIIKFILCIYALRQKYCGMPYAGAKGFDFSRNLEKCNPGWKDILSIKAV
jgi:hypothetical protein